MKRYAIPVKTSNNGLENIVALHFGRAPAFTIVSETKEFLKTLDNKSEHMGGVGKPPDALIEQKIDVLLCSELGPRAIKKFEDVGIEVYVGAQGTVENTINLFHANKLEMATNKNACKEHRNGIEE